MWLWWANWWNVCRKIRVKSNVLKYLSVILEMRAFLKHVFGGNCVPAPHIFLQTRHFPCSSERSFEQRKEMTFDRSLANITGPLARDLYCLSSQNLIKNTFMKWRQSSQGYPNLFSPIVRFLATPQRHIIASPDADTSGGSKPGVWEGQLNWGAPKMSSLA